MIYYTVTKNGKYLYEYADATGRQGWGTAEQATLYRTPIAAHEAGNGATDWGDDPLAFQVTYHNPRGLLAKIWGFNIEDYIYHVREVEGWEGPMVEKFADIVQGIREELE